MKKILTFLLCLTLCLFVFVGCGASDKNSDNDTPESTAETVDPLGDSVRTEAPTESEPPKVNTIDPEKYAPDLSKYAAYKKFDAPTGDLREIVYDHMYTMSQVKWVAGKTWTTHKEDGSTGLQLKYIEGKTYYGVPYAQTKCALYTFEDFIIDGTFTPASDLYEEIIGNHCSASMGLAYQQIIDLPYYGGLKENNHRMGLISLAEGLTLPPPDEEGNLSYDSKAVFDLNGVDKIYDAYATLGRGDILYKMVSPSGHTRMVSKVEVARTAAGKIIPTRSFVYCIEQTSAWADNKQESTWFIDRKYSFEKLASTLFTPFTLDIFHEETPVVYDAYILVTDRNDETSLKKMLKGTIETTFPINYVRATITDSEGNIVKEVLKYDLQNNYKITLRDMTYTLGADKLPAGKYNFSLKAAIARGGWEIENFDFTIE